MNNKYIWILVGILAVISGYFLVMERNATRPEDDSIYKYSGGVRDDYGVGGVYMGRALEYPHVSITPFEVVEDSRCPEGVQCVWAGTVKVKVNISRPSGSYTEVIELNKPVTTGTEKIVLQEVEPSPKAGEASPSQTYVFLFEVTQEPSVQDNLGTGGCYVGGCSNQICSSDPSGVSTCEFRAEYACYKTAKCERQSSGACGWTETAELKMCLANPPQL